MIEYTVETSLHLLQVRVSDSVTFLDLVNFITKVQKDPQYGPNVNTLFVVDANAILVRFAPDSLSTLFRRVEDSGGSSSWAFVVSEESHRSVFTDALQHFVPRRLRLCVFDDELTALQWLR